MQDPTAVLYRVHIVLPDPLRHYVLITHTNKWELLIA